MSDVEILQECRMATLEERALSRQIDRLALICGPRGIGSQALEPAGDRRTNNATAGQLQQLEGLIEKLTRKRDENLSIIQNAEAVIDRIRDRKDRVVIRYYYIEGQSEYEIAEEMDKSRTWVSQRRNLVLDALMLPKRNRTNVQKVLKCP
jgi:hypothetical protein